MNRPQITISQPRKEKNKGRSFSNYRVLEAVTTLGPSTIRYNKKKRRRRYPQFSRKSANPIPHKEIGSRFFVTHTHTYFGRFLTIENLSSQNTGSPPQSVSIKKRRRSHPQYNKICQTVTRKVRRRSKTQYSAYKNRQEMVLSHFGRFPKKYLSKQGTGPPPQSVTFKRRRSFTSITEKRKP